MRRAERGEPLAAGSVHQGAGQRGVLDHAGQVRIGIRRVERHIGRAGLQHREHGHQHRAGTRGAHAHQRLGADPLGAQLQRQAGGALVEFAIAQRLALAAQRDRLGRAARLRGDPLVRRHEGLRLEAAAARHRPCHQRQLAQARAAADATGHDLPQQRAVVVEQALDRLPIEQVGRVAEGQPDALAHRHAQREVELRGGALAAERAQAQRVGHAPLGGALLHVVVEHRLEQRRLARHALRLQGVDDARERHVLVGLRVEHALPDLGQQRLERQRARQLGTNHRRVDEEADQRLDLDPLAPAQRNPDADVALPAVTMQQRVEGRQQGHEQRRVMMARISLKGSGQRPVQLRADLAAEAVAPGRSRPVGGQLQHRLLVAERVAPVVELRLEHARVERFVLPDRVVGVLHRQRGRIGAGVAAHGGLVGGAQFVDQ